MSLKKLFKKLCISGNNLASLMVSSFFVAAENIRFFLSVPLLLVSGNTTITPASNKNKHNALTALGRVLRPRPCYKR